VPRLAKTATDTKKKTLRSTQAKKERVQKLRCEYWERIKDIEPENVVTGIMGSKAWGKQNSANVKRLAVPM
jgi:hypothetical protein